MSFRIKWYLLILTENPVYHYYVNNPNISGYYFLCDGQAWLLYQPRLSKDTIRNLATIYLNGESNWNIFLKIIVYFYGNKKHCFLFSEIET